MAKVAHPLPAAVPHRAPEGLSSRADDGVPGPGLPSVHPERGHRESVHAGAFRTVQPRSTAPVRQIAPPDAADRFGAADLPDLAERLAQARLELPAARLRAHADAMAALLQPVHDGAISAGAVPAGSVSGRAVQAAATLNSLYHDFLARLPAGQAGAGTRYQEVASAFMAHALLINRVERSGTVPHDLGGFMRGTRQLPPSRLDRAASRPLSA